MLWRLIHHRLNVSGKTHRQPSAVHFDELDNQQNKNCDGTTNAKVIVDPDTFFSYATTTFSTQNPSLKYV